MRFLLLLPAVCLMLLAENSANAGRIFQGGCSDPCVAASCGGFRATSCVGCGAAHPTAAVQTTSATYPGIPSSNCDSCGATNSSVVAAAPQPASLVDCGPVTTYQVVLQPEYFTETRAQAVTEYRDEIRYRTQTTTRQVPVEVQDFRTRTVMVPKTETKTVEFQVLVPQTGEKTVELVETVPVWNEVAEQYTVRVPEVVDVPEEYTVQVATLQEEAFSYTVYVPQVQTQQKMQRVTNVVPVTKTRVIQVSRPVSRIQTQTRDFGHWETRVESAAPHTEYATPHGGNSGLASPCGGLQMGGCGTVSGACQSCGGCGSISVSNGCGQYRPSTCGSCGGCGVQSNVGGQVACAAAVITRQVWVPNVVTEDVTVVENVMQPQEISYTAFEQQIEDVPYECTYMVYAPEVRTGTRQVVKYVPESRSRVRKVVQYNEEQRTRTRKELSYETRSKTQTVPFVKYVSENRTKEVNYTITVPETTVEPFTRTTYQTVQEEFSEEYTVRVPFTSYKEVNVQVSRMVPKLVPVTVYPCSTPTATINPSCSTCGN